jgi:hypothetical protein
MPSAIQARGPGEGAGGAGCGIDGSPTWPCGPICDAEAFVAMPTFS